MVFDMGDSGDRVIFFSTHNMFFIACFHISWEMGRKIVTFTPSMLIQYRSEMPYSDNTVTVLRVSYAVNPVHTLV